MQTRSTANRTDETETSPSLSASEPMEEANDVPALPSAAGPLPGVGFSIPSVSAPLSSATSPSFNWLAFIAEQKALGQLMELQGEELKAYVLRREADERRRQETESMRQHEFSMAHLRLQSLHSCDASAAAVLLYSLLPVIEGARLRSTSDNASM